MPFPEIRPRRLRRTETIRRMVRETRLSVDNLCYPMFIVPGQAVDKPITSMPGQSNVSVDKAVEMCRKAWDLGVPSVILFGIPERKDALGSGAADMKGPVPKAISAIKKALPELCVVADVCLCEYTDHAHCGVIDKGEVQNDATLDILAEASLAYARAGADVVAPSDMMDGRIGVIREALDEKGYDQTIIMAYSAKYASGYYGPFREAADNTPTFGDRRAYQMDPPNGREALREILLDIEEGADIVMVKPALAYLDVLAAMRDSVDLPCAAYNVSGEYAMIEAAAANGWIDHDRVMMETLTSIRRAGADIILTYHALQAAEVLWRRR